MALVIIAAVFLSLLFLLFKVFDRRRIPLLPAIVVNYVVATVCGSVVAPPWRAGDLSFPAVAPSTLLGVLASIVVVLPHGGEHATRGASRLLPWRAR